MVSFSQSEQEFRLALINHMISSLGYPKELISVEKELSSLPHVTNLQIPNRRIDLLCYNRRLSPLLMIECKRGKLTEKAMDQVVGYNHYVRAPFVAIAGPKEFLLRFFDGEKFCQLSYLPTYRELDERSGLQSGDSQKA